MFEQFLCPSSEGVMSGLLLLIDCAAKHLSQTRFCTGVWGSMSGCIIDLSWCSQTLHLVRRRALGIHVWPHHWPFMVLFGKVFEGFLTRFYELCKAFVVILLQFEMDYASGRSFSKQKKFMSAGRHRSVPRVGTSLTIRKMWHVVTMNNSEFHYWSIVLYLYFQVEWSSKKQGRYRTSCIIFVRNKNGPLQHRCGCGVWSATPIFTHLW
jgi:hypothetical protein